MPTTTADDVLVLFDEETVFVKAAVTADIDPTGETVQFLFAAHRSIPAASDGWTAGEWSPGQTWQAGQPVEARILVGPDAGDIDVDPGDYDLYLRVLDTTEEPWLLVGRVKVKGASS